MKTLISLFSIVLCLSYGKAQWVELDPGVDDALFDIYAITPDIVVAVGANGIIIKTTNGGETWVQKPSGSTEDLRKVQFPTPDIGYAVAAGDTFIKTTDGGETWVPIDIGTNCYFYDFSCVDENLIFATCSGNLIKSEDEGEVWNEIAPLTAGGEIRFLSSNTGFAWEEFNFNYLSKTENGGEMWNEITGVSPVHFLNEQVGFYYNYGLYKTIDGGNNFLNLGFGEWGYLTDIFAPSENNVWGILVGLLNGDPSSHGIVKVSPVEPYSETIAWDDDPNIDMLAIHFSDESTGYIAGFKQGKGAIWKNGTGINTMGTDESTATNEIKVYPNPASSEINILFEKPFSGVVSLNDLTGKQVYSTDLANKNNAVINVEKFAKGVYILLIKAHGKIHTQKLIVN